MLLNHFVYYRKLVKLLPLCMVFIFILLADNLDATPLLMTQNLIDRPQLRALLGHIENQKNLVVDLQRELVSRPALNPENGGQGEFSKSRWIESWLRSKGIATFKRLDYPDKRVEGGVRPNLIITYPQQLSSKPTLWVFARLDVPNAPRPQAWSGDPYSLRVNGDTLYGRGTEDNNQAIASSLVLLEALYYSKPVLAVNFGLVLISGALVEFDTSLKFVLNECEDIFRPDDYYMLLQYGNEDGSKIQLAEMNNFWVKVTVTGEDGYAGYPEESKNAFAAGADLAAHLSELDFPAISLMFDKGALFTPTRVERLETDANHIPGEFKFYIDVRYDPSYEFSVINRALKELADSIRTKYGVEISLDRVVSTGPGSITASTAPVVQALSKAVEEQLGINTEFVGTSGASMATALRSKGFSVAVWGIIKNQRNKVNESSSISAQLRQAAVMARMLYSNILAQ